jgi:hypothetical protein
MIGGRLSRCSNPAFAALYLFVIVLIGVVTLDLATWR